MADTATQTISPAWAPSLDTLARGGVISDPQERLLGVLGGRRVAALLLEVSDIAVDEDEWPASWRAPIDDLETKLQVAEHNARHCTTVARIVDCDRGCEDDVDHPDAHQCVAHASELLCSWVEAREVAQAWIDRIDMPVTPALLSDTSSLLSQLVEAHERIIRLSDAADLIWKAPVCADRI